MGKIIGIDLGTTNSCVAFLEGGEPVVIPNSEGARTTPSVVAFKDGERMVGNIAKRQAITNPDRTISSIKRDMGTARKVRIEGKDYTPQEISAMILQKLKQDAEAYLGSTVTQAVITVPAYFTDSQRQATKDAGRIAGLEVLRIINEPTAAALAYGMDKENNQKILVYDLGGGTFDVSILELFDGVVKVHASAGDNYLGGDDFTEAIEKHWLSEHKLRVEALKPHEASQLRQRAEAAKRSLAISQTAEVALHVGGKPYSSTLDESVFEQIVAPLVMRMRAPIERAMRDAGLRGGDLAEVVMVGGASRMQQLSKLAARLLGRLPLRHVAPDEAIAHGACVAAGLKVRDEALEEIILTDVCPHSLGVAVSMELGQGMRSHGHFDPIIERNCTVPVSRVREYFPVHDQQNTITLRVYQGENPWAENNLALGALEVPVPPGTTQERGVDVRFTYDINGVLQVEARVQKTGIVRELLLMQGDGGLSEEEARKRLAELAGLKTHPRDEQPNIAALARAERLYAESLGDERRHVQGLIVEFQSALATQDKAFVARQRDALLQALDQHETRSPL